MSVKIIGITGGIGCGKSTFIKALSKKKRVVEINTDNMAKEVMLPNGDCYDEIVRIFSKDILDENGYIDRKKLSSIVMTNKDELLKLNGVVHKKVIHDVKKKVTHYKKSKQDDCDYVVIESALLLDTKLKDLCDEIWNIESKLDIRIQRLCKYRGYTEEEAMKIINNQKSPSYYASNSTRTLINNEDGDVSINKIIDFITS